MIINTIGLSKPLSPWIDNLILFLQYICQCLSINIFSSSTLLPWILDTKIWIKYGQPKPWVKYLQYLKIFTGFSHRAELTPAQLPTVQHQTIWNAMDLQSNGSRDQRCRCCCSCITFNYLVRANFKDIQEPLL